MGVNDVYFISAIIMLFALPLCFLLKKDNTDGSDGTPEKRQQSAPVEINILTAEEPV